MKRKYGTTQRGVHVNKIISLANSFHGRTMATITATGQEKYHKFFTPFLEGFKYCEANNIEQLKSLVDDDTCAIMMEMVQGEGGGEDAAEQEKRQQRPAPLPQISGQHGPHPTI